MHESCVFPRSLPVFRLHCKDAADMAYCLLFRDPFQAAWQAEPKANVTAWVKRPTV